MRLAPLGLFVSGLLAVVGCSGGAASEDSVAEARVTTKATIALCGAPLPSADQRFALFSTCKADGTHTLERLEIATGATTVVATFAKDQQMDGLRATGNRFAYATCGGLAVNTDCEVHVREWTLGALDHVVPLVRPMPMTAVGLVGIEIVGDRLAVFVTKYGSSSLLLSVIGSAQPATETYLPFSPTQEFVMFFQSLGFAGWGGGFRAISMIAPDNRTLLIRGSSPQINQPFDNQVWRIDVGAPKPEAQKLTEALPKVHQSIGFDGKAWTFQRDDNERLAKLDATTGAITEIGSGRYGFGIDAAAKDVPVWLTRVKPGVAGAPTTYAITRIASDGTEKEIYTSNAELYFSVSEDKKWVYFRPSGVYPSASPVSVVPASGGEAPRVVATDVIGIDDERAGKVLVEHHDAIDVVDLATGAVTSTAVVPFNWAVYRLGADASQIFAQHSAKAPDVAELYVVEGGATVPSLVRADPSTTASLIPLGIHTLYARTETVYDAGLRREVAKSYHVDIFAP
jgi:hypothetical protein